MLLTADRDSATPSAEYRPNLTLFKRTHQSRPVDYCYTILDKVPALRKTRGLLTARDMARVASFSKTPGMGAQGLLAIAQDTSRTETNTEALRN